MKWVYIVLVVIMAAVVGFFGWRQADSYITGYRIKMATSLEHSLICEKLITIDDFNEACPSSSHKDLRVMSESVFYPHVSLCTVSVTGEDQSSLIIVMDSFATKEEAIDRFDHSLRGGVDLGRNLMDIVGENSMLDGSSSSRSYILQRSHMYSEISPSGGGLCPKEELVDLGKIIHNRMVLFLPHKR